MDFLRELRISYVQIQNPHKIYHPLTHKEGEESAPSSSSLHSTVSTVRVENVENAAGGDGRRGSASGGHFRPVQAEIFTVEQHKSRLRCCSCTS